MGNEQIQPNLQLLAIAEDIVNEAPRLWKRDVADGRLLFWMSDPRRHRPILGLSLKDIFCEDLIVFDEVVAVIADMDGYCSQLVTRHESTTDDPFLRMVLQGFSNYAVQCRPPPAEYRQIFYDIRDAPPEVDLVFDEIATCRDNGYEREETHVTRTNVATYSY